MTLFLHLIVDMLCAAVAAAGFIAFHINVRQPSSAIRIAGLILIIAGTAGWLGNSYFGFHYWRDGYFDTPVMHKNGMPPMRDHDRSDDEHDD